MLLRSRPTPTRLPAHLEAAHREADRLDAAAAQAASQQAAADAGRAIVAVNLTKEFETEHGTPRRVLHNINFRVGQEQRLAVLGRNGAGKSTLIKLLAGLHLPTSGYVHRGLRMSWPLALGGGFEGEMTGYDNMRFIARIYDAPFRQMLDFVEDFSELGGAINEPVRFYSDGMRMRLALAISLSIDFECLLIDEVLVVGDRRFQDKCKRELFDKRRHCGMILAVHDLHTVEEYCTQVLVLKDGRGRVFDDVKLACAIYASL
jgi:capsular polysaccharide transport system ATP-binding protein